ALPACGSPRKRRCFCRTEGLFTADALTIATSRWEVSVRKPRNTNFAKCSRLSFRESRRLTRPPPPLAATSRTRNEETPAQTGGPAGQRHLQTRGTPQTAPPQAGCDCAWCDRCRGGGEVCVATA